MTRLFETLYDAALEIRRDLAKGTQMKYTRVQQLTDQNLDGRERQGYSYAVRDVPTDFGEIIRIGQELGFEPYVNTPEEMETWANEEIRYRCWPESYLEGTPTEMRSPLLRGTVEGQHLSYTYAERLNGMIPAMVRAIETSPDSRRAFWPMFLPQDAIRSCAPTRIPCTIGYQAMLRQVDETETTLLWFYLQRSCDFDRFWLTDMWFARMLQKAVAGELYSAHLVGGQGPVTPGAVYHYVISLHSFMDSAISIY
jgi:hypothetical protein